MARRRLLPLSRLILAAPATLAGLLVVFVSVAARADDEPTVPNAKYNFIGQVTGNGVSVRSGPSENYYPTGKLDKGARVKVVGIKSNWLKIEPPEGSFSYVGRAFVNRHGDGKQGKVNDTANVRAGSALNPMKTTIQTKLVPGTDVRIIDEEDEYFKIEPPAGAYLYVNQQFVRPVGIADDLVRAQPGEKSGSAADAGATAKGEASTPGSAVAGTGGDTSPNPATPGASDVDSTTRRTADALAGIAGGPGSTGAGAATQPGAADRTTQPAADGRFEQLEIDFADAGRKGVLEQPLSDLMSRYEKATQEDALPESLKRVADARVAALKVRQEAREQLLTARKNQEQMKQRNQALVAERQELEERIKETQVDYFTAVGTLRPSSLQQGPRGTTLYRLTDPATGRTLVYLRAADRAQVAPLLNQFVGVRGELRKDPLLRLNVIQPTETAAVDQSKLGTGVAAAVMPPSLLSKVQPPTVSTASQNAPVEGQ